MFFGFWHIFGISARISTLEFSKGAENRKAPNVQKQLANPSRREP